MKAWSKLLKTAKAEESKEQKTLDAQSTKCLLHKYDVSSDAHHTCKSQAWWCSSARETDTGRPWGSLVSNSSWVRELWAQREALSQKIMWKVTGEDLQRQPLTPHVCRCTYTCLHAHLPAHILHPCVCMHTHTHMRARALTQLTNTILTSYFISRRWSFQ